MPNGHHGPRGGPRDAPKRDENRDYDAQHKQRASGGRSEGFAREGDAALRRADYAPRDWEHQDASDLTVHGQPDWGPQRLSPEPRGFSYEAFPSSPRDDERRAHYGYDDGYELEQRRMRMAVTGGRSGYEGNGLSRDLPSMRRGPYDIESAYPPHSLARELEDAGRRLIGKIKHVVRNPKNYTRSDERIREDVCDRLSVSHEVDPRELEVSVSAGEVTLTGVVDNRQMKLMAEALADDVPGVHDIHNQLRVRRPVAPPSERTSNVAINAQEPARGGKNIGRS